MPERKESLAIHSAVLVGGAVLAIVGTGRWQELGILIWGLVGLAAVLVLAAGLITTWIEDGDSEKRRGILTLGFVVYMIGGLLVALFG